MSFDVWNAAIEPRFKRYAMRTLTMLQITARFLTIVFCFHVSLLIADRHRGGHLRELWTLICFLFGRRGVFPNIALQWLRFFKPSFHPWDHDNRVHLARIDSVVAAVSDAREQSRSFRP